ncbi:MAG: hypothetical protein ACI8UO_006390 [Verrucomicrobiales bacterium]|jgi:hypothetical protein
MKSKRTKFWTRLGVVLVLATAAIMSWLAMRGAAWFSSPVAKRDSVELIRAISPDRPPIRRGYGTAAGDPRPQGGVFNLGNESSVKIEAIALTVPSLEAGPWRDPATLEPLASQQLLADADLLRISATEISPVLNLLVRAEGPVGFSARVGFYQVFDERTTARVGQRNWRSVVQQTIGDWTRIEIPLQIWHDTPIGLELAWLCGEPILNELSTSEPGVWNFKTDKETATARHWDESGNRSQRRNLLQVPSGADLEVADWVLALTKREFDECRYGLVFKKPGHQKRVSWFERSGFQISGMTGTRQVGPGGQQWKRTLMGTNFDSDPSSITLVRLPDLKRTWMTIPGLPDMPNGRNLENFFDVRIPLAKTQDPISFVAKAAELIIIGQPFYPLSIPAGGEQTFEDTTIGEILESQSRLPPFPVFEVVIAEPRHELHVKSGEPPFSQRAKKWWNERTPEWLQFGD